MAIGTDQENVVTREEPTIEHRSLERQAVRGTFYVVGYYVISLSLRLVSGVVLARLFSPEYFGLMTLLTTVLVGLNLFSHIGLADSVIQNPLLERTALARGTNVTLCNNCRTLLDSHTFWSPNSPRESLYMGILDYFDRLAIIHLPDRDDRLRALTKELARIEVDIDSPKVTIPDPPMPETSNGFTSRGVYGSFLSHVEIIENAYRDGLDTVWVLEDDAIFSRRFRNQQQRIASHLRDHKWDLCFIGHTVHNSLPDSPTGLLRFSGPFIWAHSYAVHRRIMPRLIEYLRLNEARETGHPDGGKMYIDAAFFFFRQQNPDVICIVSSPCLSVQKGSPSSLSPNRYEAYSGARFLMNLARAMRDECWRQGWMHIDGPQNVLADDFKLTSPPAQVWPGARAGNSPEISAKS